MRNFTGNEFLLRCVSIGPESISWSVRPQISPRLQSAFSPNWIWRINYANESYSNENDCWCGETGPSDDASWPPSWWTGHCVRWATKFRAEKSKRQTQELAFTARPVLRSVNPKAVFSIELLNRRHPTSSSTLAESNQGPPLTSRDSISSRLVTIKSSTCSTSWRVSMFSSTADNRIQVTSSMPSPAATTVRPTWAFNRCRYSVWCLNR